MAKVSWLRRHSNLNLPGIKQVPHHPISVFKNSIEKTDEEEPIVTAKVETSKAYNSLNETKATNGTQQNDTLSDAESWALKQNELEQAFQIAVNTTISTKSLETNTKEQNRRDVKDYINKAFKLPDETMDNLWHKAQNKAHSGLKLCGKLISAQGIPAMDANGKSDPYCCVGIISESDREKEKIKSGNLWDWKKEGLVTQVFRSTIKPATLEPEWNEEFELPISNLSEQVLVIEVWDSDEQTVGVSGIKGLKGFGTFLKDLKHDDDFIGRVFLNLKDVQPQGKLLNVALHSHTAKHQRGNISVHLSIKGQEEGIIPLVTKMEHYTLLYKAIVMHEAKEGSDSYRRHWGTEISTIGKELLSCHTAFYGINDTQQAVIHLHVLFDYHKIFGIRPSSFIEILDHIRKAASGRTLSAAFSISEASGLPGNWIDRLLSALQGLLTETHDILSNHLVLMDMTTPAGIESLTWWILVMKKVYQFDELVAKLPEDRRSPENALKVSIQVSVSKWYKMTSASLDSTVSSLKAITESCLSLCETVQKSIRPTVKDLVDVDYIICCFVALDRMLSPTLKKHLESWDHNDETFANLSYEVYLNIKRMCEVAKLAKGNGCQDIQLFDYQRWFKKVVQVWLKVALDKCKERIGKAVLMDEIVNIADGVGYSSSLVDTTGFLYQVVEFWNNLGWSCPEETYTFMIELINYITEAASYYVEQIYTRVSNGSLMDKATGQFTVSTQLCTVLNNMAYMQQKLSSQNSNKVSSLVEELQLESSFESLQKEKGIGNQAKALVENILDSAANDIEHKIMGVCRQLGEQFIPTVSNFVSDIVNAAEGAITEQILIPLEEYLNTNLKTLSSNLLFPVFRILLEDIWKATVDALNKSISTLPKKANQKYLYQRLHEVLQFLRGFFNANGEGLSNEQLGTDQYKLLLYDLELMSMPTRDLILQCCGDLAEQQAQAVSSSEHKYGELTLSVGYIKETGNIEVTIFQGRNLPALDKSGLSDPYVELALLPGFCFQNVSKKPKTPVQHKTLNPTFNHESVLPASHENMDLKGTILVLGAYDHDILGKNDFMGICVVLCKDIPQISNRSSLLDDKSPKRKNLILPLFHIGQSKALHELAHRHQFADSEAIDFLNVMSKSYHKESATPLFARLSLKKHH